MGEFIIWLHFFLMWHPAGIFFCIILASQSVSVIIYVNIDSVYHFLIIFFAFSLYSNIQKSTSTQRCRTIHFMKQNYKYQTIVQAPAYAGA